MQPKALFSVSILQNSPEKLSTSSELWTVPHSWLSYENKIFHTTFAFHRTILGKHLDMLTRFLRFLSPLVLVFGTLIAQSASALTITDLENRTVEIKQLPQRIVVGNYIFNFLMVGGADSLKKVVALPQDGWQSIRHGEYTALTKSFPQIKAIPSIGGYHDNILNTEKIIALKPDLVLINKSQYVDNNKRIEILSKLGIPTVVLDYHALTAENHTKSTRLLGILLDRQDTAEKLNHRYLEVANIVRQRLTSVTPTEKSRRIYVETGSKGPGEYGNTYNKGVLWGGILNELQASNIAADMKQPYASLSREYVLAHNPQTIIITGSIWQGAHETDQMRMGLTVNDQLAQSRLQGFASRAEWKKIDAVKTGEIYGVDHGSLRSMVDYTYLMYLAKIIYPKAFADFDPQAEYDLFWKTYLPDVDGSGTFFIKLKQLSTGQQP